MAAFPPATMDNSEASPGQVTRLLQEWRGGNRDALDRLIPLVYEELRVIAGRHRSHERREGALQTTALVNEAYLRLSGHQQVDYQNRAHFFAIAAELMRRILVDDARRQLREKRGGGTVAINLDDTAVAAPAGPLDMVDVLALDRALQGLERLDAAQGKLVELRFFGGLTIEETAEVLSVSPATVKREWALARAWLFRALTSGER